MSIRKNAASGYMGFDTMTRRGYRGGAICTGAAAVGREAPPTDGGVLGPGLCGLSEPLLSPFYGRG